MLGGAATRTHHLVLHQARITILTRHVVEVLPGKTQNLFAGSQLAVQNLLQPLEARAEHIIEHRAVKRLFVMKVVVEKSLVDASRMRDGIRAGSVDAQLGEFALGGFQDRPAAVFGVPVRPARNWAGFLHLTNQLVSIATTVCERQVTASRQAKKLHPTTRLCIAAL